MNTDLSRAVCRAYRLAARALDQRAAFDSVVALVQQAEPSTDLAARRFVALALTSYEGD